MTPPPDTVPRKPRWSAANIMIATMIVAMLFGGVVGFMSGHADEAAGADGPSTATRSLFAWGLVAIMLLSCLVAVPYWRRLDEAAREAHKSAWLWGGGGAYVLAVILAATLLLAPEGTTLPSIVNRDDAAGRAADAILLTVVLQSLGYGIAWLLWWRRAR